MASSSASNGEDAITVQPKASGSSVNHTRTEPVSRVRNKHTSRRQKRCKFRGIGTSSVLLILIWTFIISFSIGMTLPFKLNYLDIEGITEKETKGEYIFVVALSLPVSSLLAEVVISRYKLVRYSLRAIWFLSIVSCTLTITGYCLPTAEPVLLAVRLVITLLPLPIIVGAFLSSAIPLGIDQIITGSSDNISAFIQWMAWFTAVGILIPNMIKSITLECLQYQQHNIHAIVLLLPVVLLTIGVVLDVFFGHKLVQEPVTVNPVTVIFKVLKYAAKHKYPVQRSAFTYCENKLPSRLDYGKSKYGGPFTTEQVEDVKTFWRVLLVVIVVSTLFVPLRALLHVIKIYTDCINTIRHVFIDSSSFIIYGVPVYELMVYPCLRHRSPRILQSIGIGAAALIFSSLYGLTTETIKYFTSNGTTQCLFSHDVACFNTYIPFRAILGFAMLIVVKCTIEFICAQTPYNMRNLLIGFLFTTAVLFIVPGSLLNEFWSVKIQVLDRGRYGIWFYLTTLVLEILSSVLLVCVIRRYKARERDEIVNYQAMVEDIHYKYQQQEADNQ